MYKLITKKRQRYLMTRKERRGHEPETVSLLAEAFTPSLANFSLRSRLALRRCLSTWGRNERLPGSGGGRLPICRRAKHPARSRPWMSGMGPATGSDGECRSVCYISNRIPATIRTQSSVPTNMPLMHPVAGFRASFGDLNILLLPSVSRKSRSVLRR